MVLFLLALLFAGSKVAAQPRPPPVSCQPLPPNYGGAPPPCAQPQPSGWQPPPPYGARPLGYGPPPPPTYRAPGVHPPPRPSSPRRGTAEPTAEDDPGDAVAVFLDLVTLRIHGFDIRGSDADTRTTGFLFAIDPDVVQTSGYYTKRSTWFMAIGGGSDGLEGQLEMSSRAGARGFLGEDHGPFARIGLGFQFLGNNKIYRSQFELPTVEVGYQLLNRTILFELATTGSLVLGGRYNLGDHATRRIDTEPAVGALATLQVEPVRLHATAQRIFARQTGAGTAIDQLQAQLCVEPFEFAILCGHGGLHQGAVTLPGGAFSDTRVVYLGLTAGIGTIINAGSSPWL